MLMRDHPAVAFLYSVNDLTCVINRIIIIIITRKHRQSYRHADPRRQQQHMAVAVATVRL